MPTLTLLDDAMLRAGRMVPAINRLGGGAIAMAGSQQPWRMIGTDAVVYQLRQPSGRVLALRCHVADTPDMALADRYRALAAESTFKHHRADASFPIVGGVTYVADGLLLAGTELRSISHPVMAMDWVMGPTVFAAADRACRSRDGQYLLALAEAWRAAMSMLGEARFVHGNLTADNALVRPREGIALVDYDTAWWEGAPSIPQPGSTPAYRHPRGDASDPTRRDDFASLVIYISLRLLGLWPELRDEHGEPAAHLGGALLFSAKDLSNPDGSALFGKIRVLDDPNVQSLVALLREACLVRNVDEAPGFAEAMNAVAAATRSGASPRPAAGRLDPRDRQQKLGRLNGMLMAGRDDEARAFWRSSGLSQDPEAARDLGSRMADLERRRTYRAQPSQPSPPRPVAEERPTGDPAESWPAMASPRTAPERAPRRAAEVEQLRIALRDGDVAAVAQLWPQVRNVPEASMMAAQANDVIAKLKGAAIAGAIERGDDAGVVAAIADAEASGVAVGASGRKAERSASARVAARARLEVALASDDREALSAMALAGDLDQMEEFSPETTQHILKALATPHLLRAIETDDDAAIVASYDEPLFADDAGLGDVVRYRVNLARLRERWVGDVRQALGARDSTTLRGLFDAIPEGAEIRLSRVEQSRIARLLRQESAIKQLDTALESGDDNTIVDALNEVEAAGAMLPDDLDWSAIRGVIDRLSLVASIRRAALANPPDFMRLARLLPQARDESGGDAPYLGQGLDFEHLEDQVRRSAHRSRLREVIAGGDDRAIASAASPDLYGTLATLTAEERGRIEQAIAAVHGTSTAAMRAS